MSNRRDIQFSYNPHNKATRVDCSFKVDSTNVNGLGISSLDQGGRIANVFMNVAAGPTNTLNMGTARSYAILGASAVTNTGSSVLTGNLGISPGASITGFPPGTFSGAENIANAASATAQSQALAAYTAGVAKTATPIASNLNGQTLTPGVYSESSGTFNLAQAGAGTLILNGAGVYIFKAASTLVTGAGGTPTITLSGGALASNVYWLVGSSATINSGFTGVFQGNIIAVTSITDTLGGTVNGSLVALNGAVTLSAASIVNSKPLVPSFLGAGNPNPEPGIIVVQLQDNYNKYLDKYVDLRAPLSGSSISSGMVVGNPYVIASLGSSSAAQFLAAGVPANITPAVGVSFIAIATSIAGGALVQAPAAAGSGIDHIEVIGNPNLMNSNGAYTLGAGNGMELILACYQNSVLTAPADGTFIGLDFYLNNSAQGV